MDVSFDAREIVFSAKAPKDSNYHVYRINVDGTNPCDAAAGKVSKGACQITDGANDQSLGGPSGVRKDRWQVEQAFRDRGDQRIRLDIVGFNVDKPGDQEKLEELKVIARNSGGAYYSASDPSGLLKALQESLGLSKYVVENAQGELMGEPKELESILELSPPRARPQDYVVRLVGAQPPVQNGEFRVEQSEAIEMYLSADRRRFTHQRYGVELRDSLTG